MKIRDSLSKIFEAGKVRNFTPDREERDVKNLTKKIISGEKDTAFIIDPSQFEYDISCPGKHLFRIVFETKKGRIENIEHSIVLANPRHGQFVFMDISGIPIDFQSIERCLVQEVDGNGFIKKEFTINLFGLKQNPRLCMVERSPNIRRCYVEYHLAKQEKSEIKKTKQRKTSSVRDFLD